MALVELLDRPAETQGGKEEEGKKPAKRAKKEAAAV
jgi:hypothetical protein